MILGSGVAPGEGIGYPLQYSWASLEAQTVKKKLTCSVEDLGSIPGWGGCLGGGNGNPLQYSCLENPHGHRSLVGYSPWVCKRVRHDGATKHSTAEIKNTQRGS